MSSYVSLPAFDCTVFGDQNKWTVMWKYASGVSGLASQTVRLRFVMKDADLHSMPFHP